MVKHFFCIGIAISLISCAKDPVPKPSGELRLEYPESKFAKFEYDCHYTFEFSDFASIEDSKQPCCFYLNYTDMKRKVFITYILIKVDLQVLIKESDHM